MIRQAARLAIVAWTVISISFFCIYLLPGDPARMILGPQASTQSIDSFRVEHGLDRSVLRQYAEYIARLSRFDLGDSFVGREPVADLVAKRGFATLTLAVFSLAFAILIGAFVPLVLLARGWDRGVDVASVFLQTFAFMPAYLLALVALGIGAGWLGIVPVLFEGTNMASWILAALVLSIYPTSLLFNVFVLDLRSQIEAPYCLRALSNGASRTSILMREAMPNSLRAAMAVTANSLTFFFTSSFFIENVIGVGGLGRLAQDALRQKDIATLNGVCLAYSALVLLTTLVFDLLLASLPGPVNEDL